jgi:serine/threonine-protein kinase
MVTTYTADGKPTKPTITGLNGPGGIAVDKNGKIYVTNYYGNALMTFTASGKRTTPTITIGLETPFGVAVDAAGKICVINHSSQKLIDCGFGRQSARRFGA